MDKITVNAYSNAYCCDWMILCSSKCSAKQHSFQDVGKYHGEADLGTPTEKPPERTTVRLQGTTARLMLHVNFSFPSMSRWLCLVFLLNDVVLLKLLLSCLHEDLSFFLRLKTRYLRWSWLWNLIFRNQCNSRFSGLDSFHKKSSFLMNASFCEIRDFL